MKQEVNTLKVLLLEAIISLPFSSRGQAFDHIEIISENMTLPVFRAYIQSLPRPIRKILLDAIHNIWALFLERKLDTFIFSNIYELASLLRCSDTELNFVLIENYY